MVYSEEFKEAVNFSKENKLFLGYGNPNGKILMIGKEQYYDSKNVPDTEEFYKDLLVKRNEVNQKNITSWEKNIEENFIPDWNSNQITFCDDSNAFTTWWNQKNAPNRFSEKNGWNNGTSNTYLHYQKLYQNIFLNNKKEDNINFQKEFFLSELNDLLAKKDYKFKKLKELKTEFIKNREVLFDLPFFKSFPVVIIASGNYSREFDFNIENIFDVEWDKETKFAGKSWYNLHYGKDKNNKRLLIHTRQLSTSVPKELMEELSIVIQNFIKYLY